MTLGRLTVPGLNSNCLKYRNWTPSAVLRLPSHKSCSIRPATWRLNRGAAPCRAQTEEGNGGESTEEMFEKELRKRGLKFQDGQLVQKDGTPVEDEQRSFPSFRRPDQSRNQSGATGQLERSRQLNREGLEGLIPRVSQLVQLGGSFWLAFWPFIAAIAASFAALYLFTGSGFIHNGESRMAIPEYLPRELFENDDEDTPSQFSLDSSNPPHM